MAASAHRPMEAAMARRWKVVVIVGPVLDSPGLAPAPGMIPPPRRAEHAGPARSRRGLLAGHDPELPRGLVQHVGTSVATDHDVLDPHAILTGDVDPGLDAERDPGRERLPIAGDRIGHRVP